MRANEGRGEGGATREPAAADVALEEESVDETSAEEVQAAAEAGRSTLLVEEIALASLELLRS